MIRFAPVSPPDSAAEAAARACQHTVPKPHGALGRLEELSAWVASRQSRCPPQDFERARVVMFTGDPSEAIEDDSATIDALAQVTGTTVRVADLAVDASSTETIAAAVAAGQRIADEEVDSGADLLIAGYCGVEIPTAAAVLVAALTNTEPVVVVGFGNGLDDVGWARKTAAVRDGLFEARSARSDPVELLRRCASASLAAVAGFCAQAAVRRTPLLLDGPAVTAAALVAERLAPGARHWWQAGHRSTETGHALALAALDLEPILDLRIRRDGGIGATLALPMLRAAVAVFPG